MIQRRRTATLSGLPSGQIASAPARETVPVGGVGFRHVATTLRRCLPNSASRSATLAAQADLLVPGRVGSEVREATRTSTAP